MTANRQTHRIVTKKMYLSRLGAKTTTASIGLVIFLFGIIGVLLTLLFAYVALFHFSPAALFMLAVMLGVGVGSVFLLHIGRRTIREAKEIDVGVPLTRANTGDLPVEASLVRASSEPVQKQQAVLLRAATSADTTPAAQLVRAFQEPVQEEQMALAEFTSLIPLDLSMGIQ